MTTKPIAHQNEDGNFVIVAEVRNAPALRHLVIGQLADYGFVPGEPEWPAEASDLRFYEEALRNVKWTRECTLDDEEVFDALPAWVSTDSPLVPYVVVKFETFSVWTDRERL